MIYPWNTGARLPEWKIWGMDGTLHYQRRNESIMVVLNDEGVSHVTWTDDGKSEQILTDPHILVRGEGNTARTVKHYLKPTGPSPFIRLGYTEHHMAGGWSSTPHTFELSPERGFEECFFYILKGGSKRGIQVGKGIDVWGNNIDAVWPIKSHSFSTIPMGYHPVVGEPDVIVSYVWVYVAKFPEWEKI